jgi:myo-inositol 2-dehydrogenase / D-chiro-inositol 1-dehydrogenase
MLVFAQFGAGRIGAIHAANLAASGAARLKHVVDVHAPAAEALAAKHGARCQDTAARSPTRRWAR